MAVPYESATSGASARDEATKLLRRMGADSIGWMDIFERSEVLLAFSHRGRQMQLRASAKGWAAMFLRENPWTPRHRKTKQQHEAGALSQGLIAVNSIIRDWVKGQVTAVECGIMTADTVFLAHTVTPDGRTISERVNELTLLPPPPTTQDPRP